MNILWCIHDSYNQKYPISYEIINRFGQLQLIHDIMECVEDLLNLDLGMQYLKYMVRRVLPIIQ